MKDCFDNFQGEGSKALMNVESKHHPIKPKVTTTNANGKPWPGFSEKEVDNNKIKSLYNNIMYVVLKTWVYFNAAPANNDSR